MSKPRLSQRFALSDIPSDVYSVRVSPDAAWLACACADGALRVYAARTGVLTYTVAPAATGASDALPLTALRWRPGGRSRNVVLTSSADGSIRHIHTTSQRVLSRTVTPDQVYALDVRGDGEAFAAAGEWRCKFRLRHRQCSVCAGRDKQVYVYDESTGVQVGTHVLRSGGYDSVGHSNRVFSLKFVPGDPNLLVSGGWDNCVILWDLRTSASVKSYFGPHICGDSVDVTGNVVLAGSWSSDKQVNLYDLRGGVKPVVEMNLSPSKAASTSSAAAAAATASSHPGTPPVAASSSAGRMASTLVYTAGFSPGGGLMALGGSGANEAKLFDVSRTLRACETGAAEVPLPVLSGTIAGLTRAVYSLHFDAADGLVMAGGDFIYYFDITNAGRGDAAPAAAAAASTAAPAVTEPAPPPATATSTDDAAVVAMYGGEEDAPRDDDEEETPGAGGPSAS